MTIAMHAPFGSFHQESGLLYLLMNYVRANLGHDIVQLVCNGAFSVCDRDAERDWKRGMHSCLSCAADQQAHANWSGAGSIELTSVLSQSVVEDTKRLVSTLPASELTSFVFDGVALYQLWEWTFRTRFGPGHPDMNNKAHEQFARRLSLSTARALAAMRRFLTMTQPLLMVSCGGNDYLSRALAAQAEQCQIELCCFRWQLSQRVVIAERRRDGETMPCELVLDDVTSMRAEVASWSPPVVEALSGLIDFLDIPSMPEPRRVAP